MNIIAIETATTACGIGVQTADAQLVRIIDEDRQHTEALGEGLQALLREVSINAKDIDRVVVDHGPGLFTGLRVGIATAIALAQGVGAQLVGVSSLELLAHGAKDGGVTGKVLCAVDGRRGEIFVQTFSLDDTVTPLSDPVVTRASVVVNEWSSLGEFTLTGDGIIRYQDDFAPVGAPHYRQAVPPLSSALELAALRPSQSTIVPLYLREADAVANFSTRERQ